MQPWMNRCFLKMTISSEITCYYNNYILKNYGINKNQASDNEISQ